MCPADNRAALEPDPRRKTIDVIDVSYKVLSLGESRIGIGWSPTVVCRALFCLILSCLTGKTSIIKRLANNEFREQTISTVGLDFVNLYYDIDRLRVRLQVW